MGPTVKYYGIFELNIIMIKSVITIFFLNLSINLGIWNSIDGPMNSLLVFSLSYMKIFVLIDLTMNVRYQDGMVNFGIVNNGRSKPNPKRYYTRYEESESYRVIL